MTTTVRQRWKHAAAAVLLAACALGTGPGCSVERSGLYAARPRDAGLDAATGLDAGRPTDAGPRDAATTPDAGCAPAEACDSPGDDDCDGLVDEGCVWHFGRSSPLVRLHRSTGYHYSPVLSADGRRLYYRADVPGGPYLWVASRSGVDERFGAAEPVPITGGDAFTIYSFTLDDAELELVMEAVPVGTADPAHLFRSVRATTAAPFGMPVRLETLTAVPPWRDINPHLSRAGTEMFFSSNRTGVDRLYRATRTAPGEEFGVPELVTLSGIGSVEVTPSLSRDGLTLFFSRDWRIWAAQRESTDTAVFGDPWKLTELPDDGSTYFPFVSEATYEIFFVSERPWSPATSGLWRARLCRAGECDEPLIDCPSDGARSPDGRHCYFAGGSSTTWDAAHSDCLAAGGDLVSIHSNAEQELAWSLVLSDAWTGGNDMASECNTTIPGCTFAWTTGEPFLYASWAPGDPNDLGGEDCVEININVAFRFNDRSCTDALPFVCERELWPW